MEKPNLADEIAQAETVAELWRLLDSLPIVSDAQMDLFDAKEAELRGAARGYGKR